MQFDKYQGIKLDVNMIVVQEGQRWRAEARVTRPGKPSAFSLGCYASKDVAAYTYDVFLVTLRLQVCHHIAANS
jgi:hypothetical protein